MMARLGDFFAWTKEYKVFDANERLGTVRLNWFSRHICRRMLGFWKQTRLATVGAIAHATCFKDAQNLSNAEKLTIRNLVFKARNLHRIPDYTTLGTYILESGHQVCYKGYADDITSCCFKVLLESPNRQILREANISINTADSRDKKPDHAGLHEIYEICDLKQVGFFLDPNDILARVSYTFLSTLLVNSKRCNALDVIATRAWVNSRRVGTALIARKFGFEGEAQRSYLSGSVLMGDPSQLTLHKDKAKDFADLCPVRQNVSFDFFT